MVKRATTEPRSLQDDALGLSSYLSIGLENDIAKARTGDIADHTVAKRKGPASYNQCKGLASRWSKNRAGEMDWEKRKRIIATLWSNANDGQLSFEKAHKLFTRKTLPKVYADQIKAYLAAHVEG